ncbi:MAG: pirin family protein [Chloroflexi bacterium]|nr:pirin family protein [Chloroflexota bacterium]MCL5273818.1 pirin family protein [Chloroflexota bacterium]
MSNVRKVKRVLKSKPTIEGAGVHLKRAFIHQRVPELDPFLLLDDFHSDNPQDYIKGFPSHPHRGIETISYMLHGEIEHRDSMGNRGVIKSGGIQWMTAGSGIIHSEMPHGDADGRLWGFQLWANLPAARKMMNPRYQDITAEQAPVLTLDKGVMVRVLCGVVNGVKGPVSDIVIDPQYLDITIPPETTYTHNIQPEYTAFAYVIAGAGRFEPQTEDRKAPTIGIESVVVYGEGDRVNIATSTDGVRFLFVAGKPIREPVAWYGPIVMNTQEELVAAFDEYQNGTFLKHQTR